MTKFQSLLLLSTVLCTTISHAMSPIAVEGKSFYPACHVCHNQEMDPPLGPPMWGVQRRYKMGTIDDEDFVQSMVDFVKSPTLDRAKHDDDKEHPRLCRGVAHLQIHKSLLIEVDAVEES